MSVTVLDTAESKKLSYAIVALIDLSDTTSYCAVRTDARGLAIPRYCTTWFATKLEIASVDGSKIVVKRRTEKDL